MSDFECYQVCEGGSTGERLTPEVTRIRLNDLLGEMEERVLASFVNTRWVQDAHARLVLLRDGKKKDGKPYQLPRWMEYGDQSKNRIPRSSYYTLLSKGLDPFDLATT